MHYKWTIIILVVAFPLILFAADFISHQLVKTDTDVATRQSAQVTLKEGVLKGSLRDLNVTHDVYGNPTDVYRKQITVKVNSNAATIAFDASSDSKIKGSVINVAHMDEARGISVNPPMLAIRSNVVRESLMRDILSNFLPDTSPSYVIQNQKIAIVEMLETN